MISTTWGFFPRCTRYICFCYTLVGLYIERDLIRSTRYGDSDSRNTILYSELTNDPQNSRRKSYG